MSSTTEQILAIVNWKQNTTSVLQENIFENIMTSILSLPQCVNLQFGDSRTLIPNLGDTLQRYG